MIEAFIREHTRPMATLAWTDPVCPDERPSASMMQGASAMMYVHTDSHQAAFRVAA